MACALLTRWGTAREDAMNTFAPEIAQIWLAGIATLAVADAASADAHQDEADREKAALEELAERVTAARCVV
jgi:hypothetical protein